MDGVEVQVVVEPSFDRYATRRDVGAVPPQGSYAAKRCPLRVQFDLLPPPEAPAPELPVARARMDQGNEFEASVFDELRLLHSAAVDIGAVADHDRVDATVAAMAAGAPLILGAHLPVDEAGRRTGRPDVLVLAGVNRRGRNAYLPVDVKHHLTAVAVRPESDDRPGCFSSLAAPALADATVDEAVAVRSLRDDSLQLAHYHRMLQACGHAAGQAWGGIIGKERRVAWIDLTLPRFRTTFKGHDAESALERYDFEFAFRLDVLAAALDGAPIVEPVLIDECASCPWWTHCEPALHAADSVSLLPLHGYVQWKSHQRAGVVTRADLAALDRRTALIRDALPQNCQVDGLLAWAVAVEPGTPLVGAVMLSEKAQTVFTDAGVATAADVLALDRRVLALHGRMIGGSLAGAIDVARVAVHGGGQLHRRRGVERVEVPTADVEIDIDMENTLDGTVYLWGALVDGTYVAVVDWDEPDEHVHARVFQRFWAWVQEQRRAAHDASRTIAFHCWAVGAERGALVSGAAAAERLLGMAGAVDEVAEFVASAELVDLRRVTRDQLESGGGNGLKAIAPRAGFRWRDDEPAGDLSMLWHRQAVSSPDADEREAARRRLLTYNEDDVRATAAVRAWLRATAFPAVADFDTFDGSDRFDAFDGFDRFDGLDGPARPA